MIFFKKKLFLFSIIQIGILFLCSCAESPPFEEEINIFVSPFKLNVNSGSEDKVFVKLLDREGGPLFGLKIKAYSTKPTVATVTKEAITDPTGKAIFLVHGISPGGCYIKFYVAGQKDISASIEIVFLEH